MIDWTKPIETVPCERNPDPVPCEFVKKFHCYVSLFLRGDWIDIEGRNLFDSPDEEVPWSYDLDGTANDWMPTIRNVSPLTQG